jgi:hypothetical protein
MIASANERIATGFIAVRAASSITSAGAPARPLLK